MKKLILLATVATLIFVGLTSCTEDGVTTPATTQSYTTQYDAVANITLPNYSNDASNLIEGSFDQEIAACPPPPPGRDGNPPPPPGGGKGDGKGGDNKKPNKPGDPLSQVLKTLNLTPDQQTLLTTYMQEHIDCMKAAMQALRDSEKPIILEARTQQKAIIEQMKAGTITREEAKIALKALNETTRKALNENPAKFIACVAMQDCRKALNDYILSILDDAQKAIFQAWLDQQPVKDCNPVAPPTN